MKTESNTENIQIKEDWILALADLMNEIKEWIFQIDQTVHVTEYTIPLREDFIGSYQAPVLVLTKGNSNVEIRPAGRFSIGAAGRVDITNIKRNFTLLYASKKGWILLENRKPLNQLLFSEIINQFPLENGEQVRH